MKSDVSGNDVYNDLEGLNEQETESYTTYDYTSHFQVVENNLAVNNAILIGLLLLIGILAGLKKL